MHMTLTTADAAASTAGNWTTAVKVDITTTEVMREFMFVLDPSTDGPVSISFDGVREHIRLIPTAFTQLRWKVSATTLWFLKGATGATWKVLVMANNEVA